MQVFSPTNDLKVIAGETSATTAWGFQQRHHFFPPRCSTDSATSNIYTSGLQYDQYSLRSPRSNLSTSLHRARSLGDALDLWTQSIHSLAPMANICGTASSAAVTGRTGYALAPEIYLFASPTGYSRSYDHNAQYNSDGYQLLAGVGLDRRLWTIELWRRATSSNFTSILRSGPSRRRRWNPPRSGGPTRPG